MRDFKQEVLDILDRTLSVDSVKLTVVDAKEVKLRESEVPEYFKNDSDYLELKTVFTNVAPTIFAEGILELIKESETKGDVEIAIQDMKVVEVTAPNPNPTFVSLRGSFGVNIIQKVAL